MAKLTWTLLAALLLPVVLACDPPPAEGEGEGEGEEGEGEGEEGEGEEGEGEEGEGEIPAEWTCSPTGYADGVDCECGCGAPDPDCGAGGTPDPNDDDPACDFCVDDRGVNRNCNRTPDAWTCNDFNFNDGLNCDCGCGIDDPDCDGEGSAIPGVADEACVDCFDAAGDPVDCPIIDTYPTTSLPTDCRDVDRAFPFDFPSTPPCSTPVGSGTNPSVMGAFRSGYYDAARDAFYVASSSAIMRINNADGARSVVSGNIVDPAQGPLVVGTGPDFGNILAIRQRRDGDVMAMGSTGFFTVDADTGVRSLTRDYTGVPAQNQIRENSNFAFGADDNTLFVVFTERDANSGFGVLRFTTGGADVISQSGAQGGFAANNRGTGFGFDLGGGMSGVEFFAGDLYVSNGLSQNIMRVAVATGNRLIITREGLADEQVGESTDGYTHGVSPSDGASTKLFVGNRIFTEQIEVDLATGDRKFMSPFFRDSGEARQGENAIGGTTGILIHYDDATGILYDIGSNFVRANELATGNANIISGR